MNILVPARRFDANTPELIDRPGADPAMLRDELNNLRRINDYFGGRSLFYRNILSLIDSGGKGRAVRILDLGTGSADHPIHLAELGSRENRNLQITALDNNPTVLQISRALTSKYKNIVVEERNILDLPYPAKSFDVVLCSLTLHHFTHKEAVGILDAMYRICRIGLVVSELHRSWIAAGAAVLYTRLTTTNPMTRYDAFASVLGAFTRDELSRMATEAGIPTFSIQAQPFFRLLLTGRR